MTELLFVDQNPHIAQELVERGYPAVETDDPLKMARYNHDWIVSPANCHGYMDGGFDKYLTRELNINPKFGWRPYIDDSDRVDMTEQYLDVGDVAPWDEKNVLVAATVEKPVTQNRRPANPDVIRTCLENIIGYDGLILCPGLGTGFGRLSASEFADIVEQTVTMDDTYELEFGGDGV